MIYLYRKAQKAKKEKAEREARRFAVELQSNPDADGAAPTHPERAAPADGAATTTPKEPAGDELSLAEKKQLRNYRWKLIIGLCGPFTLQGLDTTIIASALPYIATDFNEVRQLNWIISSFNLTSAAFLPIWAQLTDIFGRHTALQAAIIIMMVGSAICTGAPTSAFGVLLLGRALQGVGAAGVGIGVRTVLADRVSLADYALNWTIFSLVATFSFSIGPVIGGYLTQSSWRWCFAINLPVGVVAIFLVFVLLRKEMLGPQPLPELAGRNTSTHRGRLTARLSTLDIGGQMLFLWGLGLLSLALTWGGGTYSWGAAAVVAPLVIGAVLTLAWLVYEYAMAPGNFMARVFPVQRAMMPWELLSQRDIGLLFIINFALGAALFAVMYFMTLYFALVEGRSSSKAGIALLYVLPGLGAGAYMAMFASNVWPRQTLPPLMLGGIASAVGITVLAWAVHVQNTNVVYGMMALTGLGIGIRMNPGSVHGLAYFPTMTAAITCLVSFAMPFGGLVGLTTMSTVFTNKSGIGQADPKDGVMWAFISMIPVMWVTVLVTTLLGNVWLGKDGSHEVSLRPYLWSVLFRKDPKKERRVRAKGRGKGLAPVDGENPAAPDVETGVKGRPVTPTA